MRNYGNLHTFNMNASVSGSHVSNSRRRTTITGPKQLVDLTVSKENNVHVLVFMYLAKLYLELDHEGLVDIP